MRRLFSLILIATVGGCSSDGATAPERPITAVTVTPATSALVIGQASVLTAVVAGGFSKTIVTWLSSNPSVASVNDTGLVNAKAVGSTTITAKAGTVTGSATITVSSGVTGLAITPATAQLIVSQSMQLAALASGPFIVAPAVAWSSSNPFVLSVSESGRITANAAGTATVTASAAGINATATIAVSSGVTGITVTPASAALIVSQSTQLAVSFSGPFIVAPAVIWSSSNAAVLSVNETGRITANAAGTATVTAAAAGLSATATITVTAGAIDRVIVCNQAIVGSCTSGATLSGLATSVVARASAFNALGADISSTCVFTWVESVAGVVSISFFGDLITTKRDAIITRAAYGIISIIVTCGNVPGVFTIDGPTKAPTP